MSLQHVLSAVRELMLSADKELPSLPAEREELYSRWFPNLNSAELEDLAKIQPDRLGIYRKTIFNGEGSTLSLHLPMTLTRLKQHGHFPAALARELHKKFPWKSNKSIDLLRGFKEFLRSELAPVVALSPEILDLCEIETLSLLIRRAPDDLVEAVRAKNPEILESLTVAQLLETKFIIPRHVCFAEFSFDVVGAHKHYRENKKTLPEIIERRQCFGVGARNASQYVRWINVPEAIWKCLQNAQAAASQPLGELAEIIVESECPDKSEQEAFIFFASILAAYINSGLVVIP